MSTVKMDKRGKILIPIDIRKSKGFFPGQRFDITIRYHEKVIEIKPYEYICRECGGEIKDGKAYDLCDECSKKHRVYVY